MSARPSGVRYALVFPRGLSDYDLSLYGDAVRIGVYSAMAFGIALSACAGRDPQPIATVQPQDVNSDCAMINAEIQANNRRAEALSTEQNWKTAQNVATGVIGVVIWPVFFAMDTKGAAGTEAAALQARQEYLASLAAQRCAPPPPVATIEPPPKKVMANPKHKPQPQAQVQQTPPQ